MYRRCYFREPTEDGLGGLITARSVLASGSPVSRWTNKLAGIHMDLNLVSNEQLMAIYEVLVKDIIRRKQVKRRKVSSDLNKRLAHFEKQYPGFVFKHFEKNNAGNRRCMALRQSQMRSAPGGRLKYLNSLLSQDWSDLFQDGDPRPRYYVYAHIDPEGSHVSMHKNIGGPCPRMPFYIGKGTGTRAYDLNRNQGHGLKLKQLKEEGIEAARIVHMIKRDMTEDAALELEAKLCLLLWHDL